MKLMKYLQWLGPCLLALIVGWFLLVPFVYLCKGNQDVTNDPAFGNFAPVIGTWKSKVPLRLYKDGSTLYLMLTDRRHPFEELCVVPAGTEVRIEHLAFRQTINTDFLNVMGSLGSGPYAGKKLVISQSLFPQDMVYEARLRHGYQKVRDMTWKVDPDKLEKSSDNPSETAIDDAK